MNKVVVGIIVTIVAVGGIVAVVAMNKEDKTATTSSTSAPASNDKMQNTNPFTNPPADQSSGDIQTGEVTMDIKDFAFAKKAIKVKKGTKVTWTNQDSAKHDISPDSESADFKASELLAKGETYSFTFAAVGTYTYHCSPHPYMKASVEVVQ